MRKIISTLLTAIILGTTLMSLPVAYAAPAPAPVTTAKAKEKAPEAKKLTPGKLDTSTEKQHQEFKDIKFNVNDLLSLDPIEQPQAYLDKKVESPIIAFALSMIDFATTIIGSLAIIVLIIGGFMFMVAQGDSTKIDEAKEIVKYAAVGLAVTFLSYLLAIFIQSLFISAELPSEIEKLDNEFKTLDEDFKKSDDNIDIDAPIDKPIQHEDSHQSANS